MLKWLQQPYPFGYTPKVSLIFSLSVGFFVFAFLALFEPFEFGKYYISNARLKMFGFGIIGGGYTYIHTSVTPYIFSKIANGNRFSLIFNEDYWKVYKEILLLFSILFSVAITNYIYHGFIHRSAAEIHIHEEFSLGMMIGQTLLVGFFPCVAIVMVTYMRWLKKNTIDAQKINSTIENRTMENRENSMVTLFSEADSTPFSVGINEIILIRSSGNYIECYIEKNRKMKKVIRRSTLADIEKKLQGFSQFLRIHRSFIVNVDKVSRTSGNAQGYWLFCQNVNEPIPVSRKNIRKFRHIIHVD